MDNRRYKVVEHLGLACPHLAELETLADAEGHAFVARTRREWIDGGNRFDQPGERFYLALAGSALPGGTAPGDTVIGMCGLNIDPYVESSAVGRLRHMYTHPGHRRQGVAEALVRECQRYGARSFDRIRLRTENPSAAALYRSLGFGPIDEPDATHSWRPEEMSVGSRGGLSPVS